MYEEYFSRRVTQLRTAKGISAREMSLSLGQSESYINKIENGKAFPSMQVFFYICEYFKISPREFFDDGTGDPILMRAVIEDLCVLNEKQISSIHEIIKGLKK